MLLRFADWLTYGLLGLNAENRAAQALNFFVYDSIKILLLLFVLIFAIGFARTWLPQERIRKWMGQRGWLGNVFASFFGALTPFCSCSSIPIFLGFLEAGIPLGVTFSFLITSPLINEYLVVLMLGFFGWKITALYVVSGLLMGTVTGLVLGRMNLESCLEADMKGSGTAQGEASANPALSERLRFGLHEAVSIVRKIWIWVLAGVAAGALIHNYVPQESIHSLMARTGIFSVPLAVILGVPLYGNCAAIVPVAVVLFQKGIPLGTALAFMMAITVLSLPEAVMLRRAMNLKLIAIFFSVTTLAIIITGYVFNLLQAVI